jgi:fructokinase
LARDHEQRHGGALNAQQIAALAASGDASCSATLARWESRLARALAHVINLLDPDIIVLGGGLSRIERLYAHVPALWSRWVFAGGVRDEPVRTRIVPSSHGDSSGVRGAAWLWRER